MLRRLRHMLLWVGVMGSRPGHPEPIMALPCQVPSDPAWIQPGSCPCCCSPSHVLLLVQVLVPVLPLRPKL